MTSESLDSYKMSCGVSQEADNGVFSFSLSRSLLCPSISVLSPGRDSFSGVTFKEDFHSPVTLLVLFCSLGGRQWLNGKQ